MDSLPSLEIETPEQKLLRKLHLPGQKRQSAYKALPPEEEKGILSKALNSGIGGLQYLGETLDKPGRAVRGLATGRVVELANLIPFSDTLGITDPSKATSGKDLLQHYGLQDKGAEGFGAGAAGFGAEMLTDPLSYLTLGASAIGKAGKVAKAAGVSLKGANRLKTMGQVLSEATPEVARTLEEAATKHGVKLADLAGEKLGGAFGLTTGPLGLLGMHGTYVPKMAQGERAGKVLEGLGKGAEAVTDLPGLKQVKTTLRGAFGHKYQGQFNPMGQQFAKEAYESAARLKPQTMEHFLNTSDEAAQLVDDLHKAYGSQILPGNDIRKTTEVVHRAIQELGSTQAKPGAFEKIIPGVKIAPEFEQRAAKIGMDLHSLQQTKAERLKAMGYDINMLNESGEFGHLFRTPNREVKAATPFKARREAIRYVSPEAIEQMSHDPSLLYGMGGTKDRATPDVIAGFLRGPAYRPVLEAAAQARWGDKFATQPEKYITNVARDLGEYLYGHGTEHLEQNKLFFKPDPIGNHLNAMRKMNLKEANGDAVHAMFSQNLHDGTQPGRSVGLRQAFQDLGLNVSNAVKYFAEKNGLDPKAASRMRVSEGAVEAASGLLKKGQSPEWMKHFNAKIDNFNKWFKQNVTLPWPSFMTRNLASGQWMNVASNEIPDIQHMGKYFQSVKDAAATLKHPEQAKQFLNELMAHGVIDNDVAAMGAELGWSFKDIPNPIGPKGFAKNFKQGWERAGQEGFGLGPGILSESVGKLPGVQKFVRGVAAPAQVGARFNQQVEFLNRAGMYKYLRDHRGWTPTMAGQKVRQLQVAYDELAPFEKEVMRRLVPFYTYTRKIVPAMLGQIAERPGGFTAQTVRASNTGRSKDEFVPPYVGEGMSVKLGPERYLSQLGLPTDIFSDVAVQGPTALGTVKRTGQKALAMTNPLLKGPLETISGQNFFTGRPIEESFPHPTKSVLWNQVIHNTPMARYATTGRKLEDMKMFGGRKEGLDTAINLLTGLRTTQPSGGLDKQQRIAESKILTEILKEEPGIRSFTDVYQAKDPTTGQPIPLSKEAEDKLRALRHLQKLQADEAKKKKKHPPVPVP